LYTKSNTCGRLIKQINDALEKNANNNLRADDLTLSQLNVLMILNELPEKRMTMKELEHILKVAQPTVVGIIKRLEQKDLVESFGDATDKRIKNVKLTYNGKACCNNAKSRMDEAEEKLLSKLSKVQQEELISLLQIVHQSMI